MLHPRVPPLPFTPVPVASFFSPTRFRPSFPHVLPCVVLLQLDFHPLPISPLSLLLPALTITFDLTNFLVPGSLKLLPASCIYIGQKVMLCPHPLSCSLTHSFTHSQVFFLSHSLTHSLSPQSLVFLILVLSCFHCCLIILNFNIPSFCEYPPKIKFLFPPHSRDITHSCTVCGLFSVCDYII